MLLLLIYQLTQSLANAVPVPSINETTPSCLDIRHCRQLSDIVLSCLATLFTCNWVVLHPDVPKDGWDASDILLRRVWHAVVALVFPEVTLYNAIQEFFKAGIVAKELENLAVATEQSEGNAGRSEGAEDGKEGDVANARDVKKKHIRWTRTHAFLIFMGGFYAYDGDKPLGRLRYDDIRYMVSKDHYVPPTEADIKDRSKADAFSKGAALLQTTWFVVQCIARRAQHLDITALEIVTIAYTAINGALYVFWWHKPLNVARPIRVPRPPRMWRSPGASAGIADIKSSAIANFFRDTLGGHLLSFIAVAFGLLHCLAWSFHFPSKTQQTAWRIACIIITAIPAPAAAVGVLDLTFTALGVAYKALFGKRPEPESLASQEPLLQEIPLQETPLQESSAQAPLPPDTSKPDASPEKLGSACSALRVIFSAVFVLIVAAATVVIPVAIVVIPVAATIAYIAARGMLLVLAFMLLKSLPPLAYATVNWTKFIPHV